MRKLKKVYCWDLSKYKSNFDCKDFRSKQFSGQWTKHLLKNLQDSAVENKKKIFELLPNSVSMKQEHFPKKLYKFFAMNSNSLSCLENQTIFVSKPSMFNDPFDCSLYTSKDEFIKSYLLAKIKEEKLIDKGELTEKEYQELLLSKCDIDYSLKYKQFVDIIHKLCIKRESILREKYLEAYHKFDEKMEALHNSDVRVCCFAALSNEQLETFTEMWAHYADNHKGFCIEYDLSNIDFDNYSVSRPPSVENVSLGGLLECTYQSKPVTLPKNLIYKFFWELNMKQTEVSKLEKQIIQSFITKSSAWSYEHEWRMIIDDKFSEIYNHLIPFPHISAVYLGCHMSKNDMHSILGIADRNNFKVFKGDMEKKSYSISFYEVNNNKYFNEYKNEQEFRIMNYYNKNKF